jgi:hypothetical protein
MSALTGIVPRLSGRSGNLERFSGAPLARLHVALALTASMFIASQERNANQSLQSLSNHEMRIINIPRSITGIFRVVRWLRPHPAEEQVSLFSYSSGNQNIDINHWTHIEIICILITYMTRLEKHAP